MVNDFSTVTYKNYETLNLALVCGMWVCVCVLGQSLGLMHAMHVSTTKLY